MPATLGPAKAAETTWDVAVVGAGPAGSLLAHELARRDLRVLLIDKADFPRGKVCGCCLGAAGLAQLDACGLGELPARLGAHPLRRFQVGVGGRMASLAIPQGAVVSRDRLDAELIRAAVGVGAEFLCGARAELGPVRPDHRELRLAGSGLAPQDGARCDGLLVRARAVVAADGLGGRLAAECSDLPVRIRAHSRIGAAAIVERDHGHYPAGVIHMACGPGGYVGAARIEDDRLDVGAALDPACVRAQGGLGPAAAEILRQAGFPEIPGLADVRWRGTPELTRSRPRVATQRLFVIGDAAAYIEPFTGEGMTWAMVSARAVAPLAAEAGLAWRPGLADDWTRLYRRVFLTSRLRCRLISAALRVPALTVGLVAALDRVPLLAAPFLRAMRRVSPRTV